MINITIPLTQIMSLFPVEVLFSMFFLIMGLLFIFVFRGYMQPVLLGFVFLCAGVILLGHYIFISCIILSMPLIPPLWQNVTWPISVKVV